MTEEDRGYINFNFDISSYRLLGRELITDRITALFEIVKNSYDANSNKVEVNFIDLNPYDVNKSKIIIKDDGLGMTLSDLENKWMVVGTSSKKRERVSPAPYSRRVVGKKGIGRFAVDLLGSKLILKTKKKGANKWVCLETDWAKYVEIESYQLTLPFDNKKDFFTDVENRYWFEDGSPDEHGTILEIEQIQEWTAYDIVRASKELSKLVSPSFTTPPLYPFRVEINSSFKDLEKIDVKPLGVVNFSSLSINLSFDENEEMQEIVQHQKGKLVKIKVPKRKFGLVEFNLYYFDQDAKRKFKSQFHTDIDGIKIYRDGIITTPFAEYEANQLKQKDIIGIDKRRYSDFFSKISSRDLLGFLELKDENNPKIIETTNRQDFIDNQEWRELKLFIIEQIEQIEDFFKYQKKQLRANTKSQLGNANNDLKTIKKSIADIKKSASPEVKKQLKGVEAELGKLQGTVNKSIKDYVKLEEETRQKENLYFSLVSLQTYAAMFSHMTKHTLGHVIRQAEYFSKHFPNPSLDSRFKSISTRIYSEFLILRDGVDFMLKYAQSDTEVNEIDLQELIDNLFNNIYKEVFYRERVFSELDIKKNLVLRSNRKALEDIFDNLISNSIKALKGKSDKKIKCSTIVENNELILYFSDNGIGIDEDDRFRIFDIFFTRTAESGGAGLGLYMVKTRIESMNGSIEVVENEFKPTGATFKITLPFQK